LAAAAITVVVAQPESGVYSPEDYSAEDDWGEDPSFGDHDPDAVQAFLGGVEGQLVQMLKEPKAAKKTVAGSDVEKKILKNIDTSVKPCDDFYQHACGTWLKKTKLPPSHSSWTRSFDSIAKKVRTQLRSILEGKAKISAKHLPKADAIQMRKFYKTCMDTAARKKAGIKPLKDLIHKYVHGVKDTKSFMTTLAALGEAGLDKLFSFGVSADAKHPLKHVTSLGQMGLGLPDRSYYAIGHTHKDVHRKLRESKYLPLISHTMVAVQKAGINLLQTDAPAANSTSLAKSVLALETQLARATVDRTKLRDPVKSYHMLSKAELFKLAPVLKDYFAARKGHKQFWVHSPKIYTDTPTFFQKVSGIITKTPASTLKAYLSWHLTLGLVYSLTDKISQPYFKFFSQDLYGTKKRSPLWQRCYYATSAHLSHSLARAFVAKKFPKDSKIKAQTMITSIEAAMGHNLKTLSWLDSTTRSRAQTKLKALVDMIGYPSKWKTYHPLVVTRSHFHNILAANVMENERNLAKLKKPVDPHEWSMAPTEVNAYYSPTTNSIVFPAAILQPPFFKHTHPMAMNFGAIGTVMGHELTHGFDDQGRLYGPHGALKSWWKPQTAKKFKKRVAGVANEYGNFVLPGKPTAHLNGNLTLGENLADNGGLHNSFQAYTNWAAKQKGGMAAQKFGKLSGPKVFFYSFAQAWCTKQSVKAERLQALTDPHSPSRFRINGAVMNSNPFAKAFKCKSGDKMSPKKRNLVWSNH